METLIYMAVDHANAHRARLGSLSVKKLQMLLNLWICVHVYAPQRATWNLWVIAATSSEALSRCQL